ncbi:fibronectin type III domain-containing protein [Catellatospora citrea]|uniref:fibronectin type III domain-containing protein n=1 Tax=Catellatospora citrea TaxID=53366 RepID=UPI000E73CC3C|nr:fibronectin type III domain-containing protein [Catellatospora citrea]RKE06555.1 fibronectin type III domain protein [Catellatospora citrea]
MAQPHPGQAAQARKLVIQLGQLLTDVTAGRPVAKVHQHLLDQFDAAVHDYRIDAMEVGQQEFAETWHALQYGLALPVGTWDQIVLPTVVGFSSAQKLKMHLELATSYWLAARAAVDAVPDYPAAVAELAAPEAFTTDHTLPVVPPAPAPTQPSTPLRPSTAEAAPTDAPPSDTAPSPTAERPAPTGPDRRVLVAVAVAVLATVTVMLVLIIRPTGDGQPVSLQDGLPSPILSAGVMADESGQPVTLPTAPPSTSPEPAPMITNEPLPKPSWTPPAPPTTKPGTTTPPPAPPVAPSAPTRLTAVAAVEHKIWLSWSAPATGGSGGVAYYRILRDGQFIGWTRDTSATVADLAPGTSYVFVVIAVNAAGLQSGPSNQITTMTASPSPLPAPSPTNPASPPPSPSESPSPSPAETTDEPSPSPSEPEASPSPEATSPDPDPPTEPADAT